MNRSMNGRSYEGLSLTGLVSQIANAISLWREVPKGSRDNDCKLVIAHAVRAFQRLQYPASRGLRPGSEGLVIKGSAGTSTPAAR
jgi:hypothetical protein